MQKPNRTMLRQNVKNYQFLTFSTSLPPQLFKPRRIGRRVNDSVLDVPVPQIILDQAGVGPLVRQGKAARMAEHVRVRRHRQSGFLSIGADRGPCRLAA